MEINIDNLIVSPADVNLGRNYNVFASSGKEAGTVVVRSIPTTKKVSNLEA